MSKSSVSGFCAYAYRPFISKLDKQNTDDPNFAAVSFQIDKGYQDISRMLNKAISIEIEMRGMIND